MDFPPPCDRRPGGLSARWADRAVGLAIAVLFAALCGWFLRQSGSALFSRQPAGYYGLLTAGFREGHLSVKLDPDPRLLALPNPYDPTANAPFRAHDMSLFRGKYYLYFGVTPVLVLYWPIAALTGWYPTDAGAVAGFSLVGLVAGLALLDAVRRRHFPSAPRWVLALAGLCLAFGSSVLALSVGATFYQVPIACAFGLNLLMWGAVYRALHSPRRGPAWLAAASLLWGLAVGARPNYLPEGLALLLACCWLIRQDRDGGRRSGWRLVLAAVLPALACGTGLALYNWLRFGSVSEFGVRFQLAGLNARNLPALFEWSRVWANGAQVLFRPGVWQRYFPFFSPEPGAPYGLLRCIPWCWLLLLALRPPGVGAPEAGRGRLALVGAMACGLAANLFLLAFFVGLNGRYMEDYAPTAVLLGGIGALALGAEASRRPRLRVPVAVLLGGTAAFSVLTGAGAFASAVPDGIAPLALERFSDRPAAWFERVRGLEAGALRLELELPAGREGSTETLFETGAEGDRRDWFQIRYLTAGTARLGVFHSGLGLLQGAPFPIPAGRRITLEAKAGSLLPPFAHPVFTDWTRDEYQAASREVRIVVDGAEVLHLALGCYPSPPQDLRVGEMNGKADRAGSPFSGKLLSRRRLPLERPAPALAAWTGRTPLELRVLFPVDRPAEIEPLLVTGDGRRSDLLACAYDGPGRVHFLFDHFGSRVLAGPSVAFDPVRPHRLTLWLGSLSPGGPWSQRLVVAMDGAVVLNEFGNFYPADPATIRVGANPFGATTALARFTGLVLAAAQSADFSGLPAGPPPEAAGAVALRVLFPGNAAGTADPLVVTGTTGAADMLYVRYLDGSHLAFGFDHWGAAGLAGAPLKIDYAQPHELELTMDSLYPETAALRPPAHLVRIVLDGRTVLEGTAACYPFGPSGIRIGRNPLGGSTCGPAFAGQILSRPKAQSVQAP